MTQLGLLHKPDHLTCTEHQTHLLTLFVHEKALSVTLINVFYCKKMFQLKVSVLGSKMYPPCSVTL